MGIKNKETFKYYYNLAIDKNKCPCGPGSEIGLVKTVGTIDYINYIIKKYNIKSINDCPCGLFENWFYLVNLENIYYTGYDINDLAIKKNKNNYPNLSFYELDMVNKVMGYADLIICRDCFFHLSNEFVLKALNNFRNSGAIYLLATHHDYINVNKDLNKKELEVEAGFRLINLMIAPYSLGTPLETHHEKVSKVNNRFNDRQLSLWRLK